MDSSPTGSSVHGIFKAKYWNGLPFPSSGDLSNPGIELVSPALAGRFFTGEPPGTPTFFILLGEKVMWNISLDCSDLETS